MSVSKHLLLFKARMEFSAITTSLSSTDISSQSDRTISISNLILLLGPVLSQSVKPTPF